mmetsp:Transcript_16658/g.21625  ORF Transcript_16658/g.21625 Transcript_16658/m.21625 type:complete len:181 (-) Transcript_16658:173-715(-)|eukprot:CAMPEP_0114359908 /NCGR_PEP_ID=MMETSP0101-20121206/23394_1 /TAXON_ID=38822 ORGANISM="Pteridomonas danica, Strain PT" /NCGR_SAMPLE_ID=MMETSP0101 /ASSEMBLY_ACC=CAM_ASM_000211 /LENGTH=180 /DNA_ID=CAMNT_0001503735 /DNA_START=36 /DNA_END=578 /DNA_ORIENTATION=-
MSKSPVVSDSKRSKNEPNDSKIVVEEALVKNILDSMGVKFQSNVLPQLVECMHSFSEDVLAEAHDYATHAGRKTTEIVDLRLALQTRSLTKITPSRQEMIDLASEVNAKKIPLITGRVGLRLPPQEISLLSREFRVAPSRTQFLGSEPLTNDKSQATIVNSSKKRKATGIEININTKDVS